MSGYVLEIASKPKGVVRRRKLSEEDWEELAYAAIEVISKYLGTHLATDAEKETLDVLDDVVEVDCEALEDGRVAFIFQEHWNLGALCGYHWYTYAIHSCWDELITLFSDRGQKIVERKPDLSVEFGPRESYAFASTGSSMVAVHPNGEAIASTGQDEDEVLPYDSESLDTATRQLATDLYESGLCRCSLCEKFRPASVHGKPAAERLPPEPEEPAWLAALKAAERGDVARLDELIASGEYVDTERCFEEAVKSPNAITVKHLLGIGHAPTAEAVVNAARYNAVEALKIMCDNGVDIEAHDDMGRSPLANAAMYGSAEAVRFLLEAGANVDATDEHHGSTALLWSVCEENSSPKPIVSMLLEAGASKEVKDTDGRGVEELLGFIEDEERRAAFSNALGMK